MKSTRAIPMIVSKRNQFRPADELVEYALPHLPDQFKHQDFRKWLTRYTETVIKSVASHFGVAAQRGIEQAAHLLCDPEFYETRRKQRATQRQQWKESQAKQEWERKERMHCPTAEQIAEQIKWSEHEIEYHRSQLSKHETALEQLRKLVPKNIRIVPQKKPN